MITGIEVDGFKSLKDFRLEFSEGLNVLVGPNGSGKTNIVSFFEFLAHLMNTDASEATSCVGGAGAVFRRVAEKYERRIQARVWGCVAVGQDRRRTVRSAESTGKLPFCVYDYTFALVFPESADSILFENQRFRIRRVEVFTDSEESNENSRWGLDIEAAYQSDGSPKVTIHAFDATLLDLPYLRPRTANRDLRGN